MGLKIIFLDVDGVLNCSTTKDRCGPYIGIEDEKVTLLKRIIDSTSSKIVLVSTWKEWWFLDNKNKQDYLANYLDMKLKKQALRIVDKTNDDNSFDRGDGILNYLAFLKENEIEVDKFIILDDEMFDYQETKLTKHLIKTDFYKGGLKEKDVIKAINLLS